MIDNHSYGIIPLRQTSSKTGEVLLVCHAGAGHWGFPKGHGEPSETPQQSAERELFEETGLTVVRYLPAGPFEEHYNFDTLAGRVNKEVTYFVAEVAGDLIIQTAELSAARFVPVTEAESILTFPEAKNVFVKVLHALGSGPF